LEYWIVEPSEKRRSWQKQTLQEFSGKVSWAESLEELRQKSGFVRGIVFSNELLDAMPIHRIGWDSSQRAWFEWGVAFEEGQFIWTRLPKIEREIEPLLKLPAGLLSVLPDGFTFEMSPAADLWWREAAQSLADGKLLTVDYGLSEDELLMPERSKGTLRGYYRHQPSPNVLAEPGEQDLTAHVNFSRIQAVGESAGLKTELFVSQAQFLTVIASQMWQKPGVFGEWSAEHSRQFQTLTHPEHLGRPFRVLVQKR
jgi:SAM-dependent MidA family methyltransferase